VGGKQLVAGDELFLSTDALAYWIFDSLDSGRAPWAALRTQLATGPIAFEEWVNELRAQKKIQCDDTTLMRITTAS
jgi:hypothetical protein